MISIIIPAREEEKQIEGTLLQFKGLTIPYETIVCDDGSLDKTVSIAKQYATHVLQYTGPHVISAVRNAGVKLAQGDILVFIDADSRIPKPNGFFKCALDHFAADPNLVALASPQRVAPELERPGDMFVYGLDNLINRFLNNVLGHGAGAGKCIIARKNAFERVGGFREDLVFREDGDFVKRLSKIGRTYMDPQMTVYHSGRRLHQLGLFRFYYAWILNLFYIVLFDRARDKEWTPVR